jgi:hypothetical protein
MRWKIGGINKNNSVKEDQTAAYFYHHPDYRFNCAQAIVHHWTGNEKSVLEMKQNGGGRAENGICGALHGALFVADGAGIDRKAVTEQFVLRAGSFNCREIRQSGNISCQKCVEVADQVLKDMMNK